MTVQKRGPLPPVLFLAALLIQWGLHAFVPIVRLFPGGWAALGILPIVAGVGVMVVGNRQFTKAKTAISPFDRPSALVTGGVFGLSRNPMYLAMLVILIGGAVAWGTLTPFLVPPVLAGVLSRRFIAMEEAAMSRAFGDDYDQYKRRVRRWL